MAISSTTQFGTGADTRIFRVIATATADKTATLAHTLGASPAEITLTPLLLPGVVSGWFLSSRNTTNIVLVKRSTAASSNAGAQLEVLVKRPHTYGR